MHEEMSISVKSALRSCVHLLIGPSFLLALTIPAKAQLNPVLLNPGLQQQNELQQKQQMQIHGVPRTQPAPLINVVEPVSPVPVDDDKADEAESSNDNENTQPQAK